MLLAVQEVRGLKEEEEEVIMCSPLEDGQGSRGTRPLRAGGTLNCAATTKGFSKIEHIINFFWHPHVEVSVYWHYVKEKSL